MPWRPGLTPVTAEVHAGEVYVGTVEARIPYAARPRMAARRGMTPASIIGSSRCHATPSRPMTTALTGGMLVGPQAAHEPPRSCRVEVRVFEDREAAGPCPRCLEDDGHHLVLGETEVGGMPREAEPREGGPQAVEVFVIVERGRDHAPERDLSAVQRAAPVDLVDRVADLVFRAGGGSRRAPLAPRHPRKDQSV